MNVHSFVKFIWQIRSYPSPEAGCGLTHPSSDGLLIKKMRQQVKTFPIARYRTLTDFPPAHPHLIGVSGGRDSVALLHWLTSLGYQKLIVCHLDHQLR